jgi:hypothetical protein
MRPIPLFLTPCQRAVGPVTTIIVTLLTSNLHLYVGSDCLAHRFCSQYATQTRLNAGLTSPTYHSMVLSNHSHLQHIKFENALKSYL